MQENHSSSNDGILMDAVSPTTRPISATHSTLAASTSEIPGDANTVLVDPEGDVKKGAFISQSRLGSSSPEGLAKKHWETAGRMSLFAVLCVVIVGVSGLKMSAMLPADEQKINQLHMREQFTAWHLCPLAKEVNERIETRMKDRVRDGKRVTREQEQRLKANLESCLPEAMAASSKENQHP